MIFVYSERLVQVDSTDLNDNEREQQQKQCIIREVQKYVRRSGGLAADRQADHVGYAFHVALTVVNLTNMHNLWNNH